MGTLRRRTRAREGKTVENNGKERPLTCATGTTTMRIWLLEEVGYEDGDKEAGETENWKSDRRLEKWKGDGMRRAKSQKERSRPGRGGRRGGRGDFTLAICWGCLTVQPPTGGAFFSTSGGTLRVLLLLDPIDLPGYSDLFNCLLCPLDPQGSGRRRLSSSLPSC